jgi:hypothetical protein
MKNFGVNCLNQQKIINSYSSKQEFIGEENLKHFIQNLRKGLTHEL